MTALATVDTSVSTPNRHAAADFRYKEWLKTQLKEPTRSNTHAVALSTGKTAEIVTLKLHTGRTRPSTIDLSAFTDVELDLRHLDGKLETVEWGADEFDGKVFAENEYTLTEMLEASRAAWRESLNPVKKPELAANTAPVAVAVDEDDEQDSVHAAATDELELPKYDPKRHAKHFEDTSDEDDLAGAA